MAGASASVLDSDGNPAVTIELVEVRVVPVKDIDDDFARAEGRGYRDAAAWRAAHEDFFRGEGVRGYLGHTPPSTTTRSWSPSGSGWSSRDDVGCGTGAITWGIAQAVSPDGTVADADYQRRIALWPGVIATRGHQVVADGWLTEADRALAAEDIRRWIAASSPVQSLFLSSVTGTTPAS